MAKNVINLYACGGAGINIAASLKAVSKHPSEGYAEIKNVYIDTSLSNVTNAVDTKQLFLIEGDGIDGSGKHQRTNIAAIGSRVKECLLTHPASPSLNIVLSSASGGSGSVIAVSLVKQLIESGQQVLVIVIGSSDSKIEISNTVKTLKSYEMTANNTGAPILAILEENNQAVGRGGVDQAIHNAIMLLSAIWSGQNRELDSADLKNFLGYNKVTSFTPALTAVKFFSKEVKTEKDEVVVAAVSISDGTAPTTINTPVEYQAVGFMTEQATSTVGFNFPLHVVAVANVFHPMIVRMDKTLAEYDARRQAVSTKSLVTAQDASEDGFAF